MYIICIALVIFASVLETSADCTVGGTTVPTGPFTHPEDVCKVCFCCPKGGYTCKYIKYAKAMCGTEKQEWDQQECGMVCKAECDSINCTAPDYPEERMAFLPDSCCPSKGCSLTSPSAGDWTFPVTPVGSFGSCNRCNCSQSGAVTCNPANCSTRLECVDPVAELVDGQCTYSCPNGPTCRRTGVLLRPGEFTQIGFLVCTCVPGPLWYPRGFCMKPTEPNEYVALAQTEHCAAPNPEISASENITRIDYAEFLA